jgi:hypothetical protein
MIIPLEVSPNGTIAADGSCEVRIGPMVYGTKWVVKRIVVTCTSSVPTQFRFYRDFVSVGRELDSTFRGNDAISETNIEFMYGSTAIGKWTLGIPGSICVMNLYGDVDTRR